MKISSLNFSDFFHRSYKILGGRGEGGDLKYLPLTDQSNHHGPFLRKLEAFWRLSKDKLW